MYPNQQMKAASALVDTRGSCNYEGLDLIVTRINAVLETLSTISESHSDIAEQASGLYSKIKSGPIIVILAFFSQNLGTTYGLNVVLHERKIDWIMASSEIQITNRIFKDISKSEILKYASKICDHIGISLSTRNISRSIKVSEKIYAEQVLDKLHNVAIPCIMNELQARFGVDSSRLLASFEGLNASSESLLDSKSLEPVVRHYGEALNINKSLLNIELTRAKIAPHDGMYISCTMYPNLAKIKQLTATLPVTSATVERSFSAFRRIMT